MASFFNNLFSSSSSSTSSSSSSTSSSSSSSCFSLPPPGCLQQHSSGSNRRSLLTVSSPQGARWVIRFSDGEQLKLARANAVTVRRLQQEKPQLEIASLLGEDDTIFDLQPTTGLFYENESEFPPGVYRVQPKQHPLPLQDITRAYYCANADPATLIRTDAHDIEKLYVSEPDSPLSYLIGINDTTVIVGINASNHNKLLLNSGVHADVPNVGSVHGTGYQLATLLPYSTILSLCQPQKKEDTPTMRKKKPEETTQKKKLIFCGTSLSGIVCHIAAIMARMANSFIEVTAITFNSPSFGSKSLLSSLSYEKLLKYHYNICYERDGMVEALNLGIQVSYERTSSMDQKVREFLDRVYQLLNSRSDVTSDQASELRHTATNIVETMPSNLPVLIPLGCHVFYSKGEIHKEDNEDAIQTRLQHAMQLGFFSTHHQHIPPKFREVTLERAGDCIVANEELQPVIEQVRVICTPQRVEINIEGRNLEAIWGRQNYKIQLVPCNQPISCIPSDSFSNEEPMMVSRSNMSEVRLVSIDSQFIGPCKLVVRTDFGKSEAFTVETTMVVKAEEPTQGSLLYSRISFELLGGAFLRGVLGKSYGLQGSDQLLSILSELEEIMLPTSQKKLSAILAKYPEPNLLHYAKNEANREVFSKIVKMVSDPIELEFKGNFSTIVSKILGAFGVVAGGVLTIAAGLAALPGFLLMVPAGIAAVNNAPEWMTGFLAVPGALAVLVPGLVGIGSYTLYQRSLLAFSDSSTQQYMQLLKFLLKVLGGNPVEVLEDVSSLEAAVCRRYEQLKPGKRLSTSTAKEVEDLLNSDTISMQELMKGCPNKTKAQIVMWFQAIGRFEKLRRLLERNLVISFVGVHNAGKSSFLEKLFDLKTGADSLERTEKVGLYRLGTDIYNLSVPLASSPATTLARSQSSKSFFNKTLRRFYERPPSQDSNNVTPPPEDFDDDEDFSIDVADFPGMTDERAAVATITERICEISSFFVCVFSAGHIAGPERKVVEMVQQRGKDILVLINKKETLADFAERIDDYRKNYAKVLQVPENHILFTTCLEEKSCEEVRSRIFDHLRTFSGIRFQDMVALLMMPPKLRQTLLPSYNIQDVSTAAASLMTNIIPLSEETIKKRMTDDLYPTHFVPQRIAILQTSQQKAQRRSISSIQGTAIQLLTSGMGFESRVVMLLLQHLEKHNDKVNSWLSSILTSTNITNDEMSTVAVSHIVEVLSLLQGAIQQAVSMGFSFDVALSTLEDTLLRTFQEGEEFEIERFIEAVVNKSLLYTHTHTDSKPKPPSIESSQRYCISTNNLTVGKELFMALRTGLRFQPTPRMPYIPREIYRNVISSNFDINSMSFQERRELLQREIERRKIGPFSEEANPIILPKSLASEDGVAALMDTLNTVPTGNISFFIAEEQAVDMSGVFKSIFSSLGERIRKGALFKSLTGQEDGSIYISPKCYDDVAMAKKSFRQLGRLIGYTILYSSKGVVLPAQLSTTIFKIILGQCIVWDDLQHMQHSIANGIRDICLLDEAIIDDLLLTFQIDCDDGSYKLLPKPEVPVTADNRKSYLECRGWFYLGKMLPLSEISCGFQEVIGPELVCIFNPQMLQILTCGQPDFQVSDLKNASSVINPHLDSQPGDRVVAWFWRILSSMTREDKLLVFAFVTGNSITPPGGFASMDPKFTILLTSKSNDRLPEAHTCFNLIELPLYDTMELLEEKLRLAIHNTSIDTFGLR